MSKQHHPKMVIGWREWVVLPELGLHGIKAKVDTGAKTSALHATDIATFDRDGRPWISFHVHLRHHRTDTDIPCQAPLLARRRVTNSGGKSERRFVILTPLVIAGMRWDIELTLTKRSTMQFPMLLGRSAMQGRLIVDPHLSYQCGGKPGATGTVTGNAS